tara:strand:- start:1069 stop:1170 length:102 start_codon:yes stop_codon:yes gene_type:complete
MKKFQLGAFLLGLAGIYATVWVARKGWEQGAKK